MAKITGLIEIFVYIQAKNSYEKIGWLHEVFSIQNSTPILGTFGLEELVLYFSKDLSKLCFDKDFNSGNDVSVGQALILEK